MKKTILAILAVLLMLCAASCNDAADEKLVYQSQAQSLKITSLSYEKSGERVKVTVNVNGEADEYQYRVGSDTTWHDMKTYDVFTNTWTFQESQVKAGLHFKAINTNTTKAVDDTGNLYDVYDASGWLLRSITDASKTTNEYLLQSEGVNYYNCIFENKVCSDKSVMGSLEKVNTSIVFKANSKTVYSFASDTQGTDFADVGAFITAANKANAYVKTEDSDFKQITNSIFPVLAKIEFTSATTSVAIGETTILTIVATPSNVAVPTLSYVSSNTEVATVDEGGVVTGVGAGTATITATSKDDPSITAICTVTVSETPKSIAVCFTAGENGAEIAMAPTGSNNLPSIYLVYSLDNTNWSDFVSGYSESTPIALNAGEKIYIRAGKASDLTKKNTRLAGGDNSYWSFNVKSGSASVSGNIMALLDGEMSEKDQKTLGSSSSYAFTRLFFNNKNITDVSELLLPATTLSFDCYAYMFSNCSEIITAPKLPATTLDNACYYYMFAGCSKLASAPELPAKSLSRFCYNYMFQNCINLKEAPALPATEMDVRCYAEMFLGCTSLKEAPALNATTLAESCYLEMFQGCTSLEATPALPATILVESCYSSMFEGCTSLTTASTISATTLAKFCCREMFKDCTKLTTAPNLLATTLTEGCYYSMFYGCSSLKSIEVSFTNWNSSNDSTTWWLQNVPSTGTFTCPAGLTIPSTRTVNNVPSGWTVNKE